MEEKKDQVDVSFFVRLLGAVLLGCLSLVKEFTYEGIKFSGGTSLLVLAALILLWPLIRELANRGGSTEFMGIKLQLNSLEKKTEEDLSIRIEQLRSDLEMLRSNMPEIGNQEEYTSQENNPELLSDEDVLIDGDVDEQQSESLLDNKVGKSVNTIEVLQNTFYEAVEVYRENSNLGAWRERVEADKKLTAFAGIFPVGFLRDSLDQTPEDQTISMAVAVLLGVPPKEDRAGSAELLGNLLFSKYERTRFRAAKSIQRRAERSDITHLERGLFEAALNRRRKTEKAAVIREALDEAIDAVQKSYLRIGDN